MKNLFLHQFRKDVRQTWVLWALWLLFTLIQFGLAAWNVGPSNVIGQSSYAQLLTMVPMIHGLILFVLIPALILQEPTVGVNAFWLTRPIPRGTILGSKVLALLILVLFPTLGQCTVLLAHGIVAQDILLAGLQIALHELSWIALIMMIAALSPNFTRYLIAAVVLYALQFAADWIYTLAFTLKIFRKTGDFFFITPGLSNSRAVAADLLRILFSLGVVFFQYRTRRTMLSIALAVGSVLVCFFTLKYWPWNFLSQPAGSPPTLSSAASKVNLSVGQPFFCNEIPDFTGGKPKKVFQTTFKCQNGDLSKSVNIVPIGAELTFPDGKKLTSLPLQQISMPIFLNPNMGFMGQSLDAAIGYLPMMNSMPQYGGVSQQVFIMNKEDFDKYNGRVGKLTIRLKVQLSDYRVSSEWPFQKGAVVRKGSEKATLTDILQQKSGVKVDLQTRTVQLLLRPPSQQIGIVVPKIYVLVSTKKGEAIAATPSQQFGNFMNLFMNNPMITTLIGGGTGADKIENTYAQSINFGSRENNFQNLELPISVTDEWLSGAKLLEMEKVPTGEFEQTITAEDFKISNEMNRNSYERSQKRELPDELKGIQLSENPSRSEAWKYILRIVGVGKNSFSSDDPEVDLLTKVGPANADELFMALYNNPNMNFDLISAINKMDLTGTPCKEMLLRYLPLDNNMNNLIDSVIKNHWQADARGILLAKISNLTGSDYYLGDNWIKALASLRDPSTYPALLSFTSDRIVRNRGNTIDLIRNDLPGPLISSMIGKIWNDARGKKNEGDFLATAASWGVADALLRASEILSEVSNGTKEKLTLRNVAREAMRNTTACPDQLLDSELANWYTTNKSALVFDPHLGRFLADAHPSVDQQAPWPKPSDYMKSLGELAAKGNTAAIDEIADALTRIVEGLDPAKDASRINQLRSIGYNAFNVLQDAAVKDSEVFKVLQYANNKDHLNEGFVPNAYSAAAAQGNQSALDALIHYKDNNWSLLNAIGGLRSAVSKNNPQAVDFVLSVYADPTTATLTDANVVKKVLTDAIKDAANAGNEKAVVVYKEIQKNGK